LFGHIKSVTLVNMCRLVPQNVIWQWSSPTNLATNEIPYLSHLFTLIKPPMSTPAPRAGREGNHVICGESLAGKHHHLSSQSPTKSRIGHQLPINDLLEVKQLYLSAEWSFVSAGPETRTARWSICQLPAATRRKKKRLTGGLIICRFVIANFR
jgi:hypothetical protein